MKKVFLVLALTAFASTYTANTFAQDGKKETKTEKKCDKKKKCCKKETKTCCSKKK
ncbi:MAG: hypothetical protein HUJ25_15885 [Crocinitomicaceae bacterium]|nr:hypothetical protein [Crocinitomicaceae bacterium]